jgi:LuxR family transcriptional regulator, maltose regulon positive regulatory protein
MNMQARTKASLLASPLVTLLEEFGKEFQAGRVPSAAHRACSLKKAANARWRLVSIDQTARTAEREPPPSAGPAFELLESKLRGPVPRRAAVPRKGLVRRLTSSREAPIVAVFAGPGYGKTTLITQWADAEQRPFAWVSLDERDNDPVVLLTYIAAALDRVEQIPPGVFESLSSPGAGIETVIVPRLAAALSMMTTPFVLALDDVHVLRDRAPLDAIATLVAHLPAGSQIILAGRVEPDLPLARLRAQREALDIGAVDLAFETGEADALLRATGVQLPEPDVVALVDRTEGWPIGLYLAALSMEAGGASLATAAVAGDDVVVAEYLRSELLDRQPPKIAAFLTRTSALDEMCGSICDAVLGETGSGRTLESIARQNLLVTPLDRRQEWFRYHHLFRDLLLSDLTRREPEAAPELRRRAAQWCEENGQPETALDYAQAAGDADHAARLFVSVSIPAYASGRVATLKRWVKWFEQGGSLDRYPVVALISAFALALVGEAERAVRFASAVDGTWHGELLADGVTPVEAFAALFRTATCREGEKRMSLDARSTLEFTPEASPFRSNALLLSGVANLLAGDNSAADADFADAAEVGSRLGVAEAVPAALAERSILAIARGDWASAETLAPQARSEVQERRLHDYPSSALAYAASARVALHRGDSTAASSDLVRTQRLRPQLTHAIPWLSVQVRLELAHAYLALADPAGARTVLREIDQILRHRPGLGVLVQSVEDVKAKVEDMRVTAPGMSTLTSAELRVLPFLATHLTLPEIGERLFLSRHTVKSQAISAYRKLGVSTRGEAVERARELGLLEAQI